MKKHTTGIIKEEAGNVLIIVALMMVVLLLMTALVIDVGNLFYRRERLQNAADAAALAAAAAGAINSVVTEEELKEVAKEYVSAHGLATDEGSLSVTKLNTNKVKIVLTAEEPLFFGPLVNITNWNFGMQSTAEWVYGGNIALIPNPENAE